MRSRNWDHIPTGHPLQERLARIAHHLPGYTLGQYHDNLALHSTHQKTILIGTVPGKTRFVFRGVYPAPEPRPSWWSSGADATITVAATKPDHVIAAEIQRRLLPGYLDELADVRRRIHDWNRAQSTRKAQLDTILTRLPGSWLVEPTPPRQAFIRASRWNHPLLSGIEIQPSNDGTTADITITGAAGPFLQQVLDAAADALRNGPSPDGQRPLEEAGRPEPTSHQYLTAVVDILNRPGPWSPDTLDDIAEIITVAGFPILDNAG